MFRTAGMTLPDPWNPEQVKYGQGHPFHVSSDDILTFLRLALAVSVLVYASVLDWRTRRVPNPAWIILSVVGMVLIPVQILADEAPMEFALVLVPVGAVLADVFLDSEEGRRGTVIAAAKYAIAVGSIILLGIAFLGKADGSYFSHLLAVPALMLVFVILYFLDVLKGGADAKALIALAVLFPFYPATGTLLRMSPIPEGFDTVFPFAFTVLFTAAIVVAITPLGIAAANLTRGDRRFPQAFLGFRKEYKELQGGKWWLMERIEEGRHVFNVRPRQDEDFETEIEKLVASGHTRVWVTAKIPFMIPLLVAVVVNAAVGNVLYILVSAF